MNPIVNPYIIKYTKHK